MTVNGLLHGNYGADAADNVCSKICPCGNLLNADIEKVLIYFLGKMMIIRSLVQFYDDILLSSTTKVSNVIAKKDKMYNRFYIGKKSGEREINAIEKNSQLYELQKNLIDNWLCKYPQPTSVIGFVKGKSYFDFLENHINSQNFIRIDITDFFGSIKKEIFIEMISDYVKIPEKVEFNHCIETIWQVLTLDDKVPQGAVSSPAFSNFIFSRIDQRILKYCQKLNVNYTRYADDLLFSSDSIDFSKKPWFLKKIKHILGSKSFKVNYSKLKVTNNGEINLNGFVVSRDEVRLSRRRLSNVKRTIYWIFKFENLMDNKKSSTTESLLDYLSLNLTSDVNELGSEESLIVYLSGYRSHLIGWIQSSNTNNRKSILRTIRQIENAINFIIRYMANEALEAKTND